MSEQSLDNLTTNELTPTLDAVSDGRSGDVVSSSPKAFVLTSAQVREALERAQKATPGDVLFDVRNGEAWRVQHRDTEADCDFDYAARADVPNLCETIADRDRENERLRESLKRIYRVSTGEDQLADDIAMNDTEALGYLAMFVDEALARTEQPMPEREFILDRLHYGQVMAEGAKVMAVDLGSAIAKARGLFRDFPDDTFTLRTEQPKEAV